MLHAYFPFTYVKYWINFKEIHMKKENHPGKLSNHESLVTTICTAICLVFVMGGTSVSFADDDYDGDDDSQGSVSFADDDYDGDDDSHGHGHGHGHGHEYVLSLGDSLSVGVQPNLTTGVNERTDDGYADGLIRVVSEEEDDLRLVKLGCENLESTDRMIYGGGNCEYEEGSQLAQAVKFLREHGDDVKLVTLDIGVNDIFLSGCITEDGMGGTVIDDACLVTGPFADVAANLPIILATLREAADEDTPIIGMNYYNTFLALWFTNPDLAFGSAFLADYFNGILGEVYAAFDVPVADVAGASAFDSNNYENVPFPVPGGVAPRNVALICTLTYMCAPAPVGPNIHANPEGYSVITNAFLEAMRSAAIEMD
jgi:lysophospholipase L1-like esterase